MPNSSAHASDIDTRLLNSSFQEKEAIEALVACRNQPLRNSSTSLASQDMSSPELMNFIPGLAKRTRSFYSSSLVDLVGATSHPTKKSSATYCSGFRPSWSRFAPYLLHLGLRLAENYYYY